MGDSKKEGGAEAGGPEQFTHVLLDLTSKLQLTLDRMEDVVKAQRTELDKIYARIDALEKHTGLK